MEKLFRLDIGLIGRDEMTNDKEMSPDESPETMRTQNVRRVNNMPLIIVGVLLGLFLVVMMLVAIHRAQRPKTVVSQIKTGNTSMLANAIAGNQKSGFIKAYEPPKLQEVPTKQKEELLKPNITAPQHSYNNQLLQIQKMKFQMLEEAAKAKTTVQISPQIANTASNNQRSEPMGIMGKLAELQAQIAQNAQNGTDPTVSYTNKLAEIQRLIGNKKGDNQQDPNDYSQFDQKKPDRWTLDSTVDAPTRFELRAGYVIPALLISGINSELPGEIMGQVSQNVYDTGTGKYLLIPQGSRLVGTYSSKIIYGQSRVLIAWQRVVFPDGKALDMGAMPGADSAGYSGFNDLVDDHYLRIFGSAFLMSGVVAGVELSQDNGTNGTINSQNANQVMSAALGQQLGQAAAQMISKNLNIAPTLQIRPGYRFNVIVVKDISFKSPYNAFDYSKK